MGSLPLTLMITLSSSLFVALTIIPTLCSMFMKLDDEPRRSLSPVARRTVIGGGGVIFRRTFVGDVPETARLGPATD